MEEKSRAQELSVREISLIRELAQIRKEHKRELEYEKFDGYELPPRTQFSMLNKPAVSIKYGVMRRRNKSYRFPLRHSYLSTRRGRLGILARRYHIALSAKCCFVRPFACRPTGTYRLFTARENHRPAIEYCVANLYQTRNDGRYSILVSGRRARVGR